MSSSGDVSSCSEADSEEETLRASRSNPPMYNENDTPVLTVSADATADSGLAAAAQTGQETPAELEASLLEAVSSIAAPPVHSQASTGLHATAVLRPEQHHFSTLGSTRSYGTLQPNPSMQATRPLMPTESAMTSPEAQPASFGLAAHGESALVAAAAAHLSATQTMPSPGSELKGSGVLPSQPSAGSKLRQSYAQSMLMDAFTATKEGTVAASMQRASPRSLRMDASKTILARHESGSPTAAGAQSPGHYVTSPRSNASSPHCTVVQPFHLSSSNYGTHAPVACPDAGAALQPGNETLQHGHRMAGTEATAQRGTATRGRSVERRPRGESRGPEPERAPCDLSNTLLRARRRAASGAPRMQPFRLMGPLLHERTQQQLEATRQAELTAMERRREFHARPISPGARRGSPGPTRPRSATPPTRPRPFQLASYERHEKYVSELAPAKAAKFAAWEAEEEAHQQAEREQEERARQAYRRHLNSYFRARPVPDMSTRFEVNHELAQPATKPQPFHLSEAKMLHVPAHPVGRPR